MERWLSSGRSEPPEYLAVPGEDLNATASTIELDMVVNDVDLSPAIIDDDSEDVIELANPRALVAPDSLGLPIGSGPVESACKNIVNARLTRSGMRWSMEGGQNVLNLRVHLKSDRWDPAWSAYLNRAA